MVSRSIPRPARSCSSTARPTRCSISRSRTWRSRPDFVARCQAVAAPEYLDVLIVGAGLSGVAAAYHLQRTCPGKTYAILEGRAAMGGTWDLFRYPGVRSD